MKRVTAAALLGLAVAAAWPAAAQETGAFLKMHPSVDDGLGDVGDSILNYRPRSLELQPASEMEDGSGTAELFSRGFTGGFGYRWNQFYGAVEADVSRHDERHSAELIAPSLDSAAGGRVGKLYGLSGILGMRVTQDAIIYGKLGYLHGDLDRNDRTLGSHSSNIRGLSLGAGVSMDATDNLSVFGEFLHFDFESLRGSGNADGAPGASDASVFRAGVRYRF
ncbi:MAG: outer membrane protein [Gammaproteobacteria bacterium]